MRMIRGTVCVLLLPARRVKFLREEKKGWGRGGVMEYAPAFIWNSDREMCFVFLRLCCLPLSLGRRPAATAA